jgi:putative ABC transport system permease protein
MRSVWAAGLLLRRLRFDLGSLALLFVVIATTSFLVAAAPRLFNRVADDALRTSLRSVTAVERDLRVTRSGRIAPGPDGGVAGPAAEGERIADAFPASVAGAISGRSLVVTSVRLHVRASGTDETLLFLRYQDGLTAATRLVAGRWPASRGVPLQPAPATPAGGPSPAPGTAPGGPDEPPVTLEAAFSTREASTIGVGVGDRLAITLDRTDPLVSGRAYGLGPAEILVVGLFEPIDEHAPDWSGDTNLLEVFLTGPPLRPILNATAYIPGPVYADLYPANLPFHYEWRFHVDPERLDAGQADVLAADLERLSHAASPVGGGLGANTDLFTGLPAILDRLGLQRALTESVLSLAAVGPLVLAGGAIGMLAVLLAARRRDALALARGRGASASLVLGAQLWEALLVAGAGAVAGFLLAIELVPARDSPLSGLLALGTGAASVIGLVAASAPTARQPPGPVERDDRPGGAVSPRRTVVELAFVGIALVGALLLARRGLVLSAPGQPARFDPLLAAVPVLAGLAAGIVAIRLYRLPVRALGWLAARRRDLVPVHGLRTLGRDPAVASLPLLVLLAGAAFGAFSSVIASSIDHGLVAASYLAVGADYRVDAARGGKLPDPSTLAAIPGVEAVAAAVVDPAARLVSSPSQRSGTYLDAIDTRGYAAVAAGSPAEPAWPVAFLAPAPVSGAGSDARPIPAILPLRQPGATNLATGQTFSIVVGATSLTFRLVERRATFPGLGNASTFAVVPLAWLQAALGDASPGPTVIWLRGPAGLAGPLAAAMASSSGTPTVVSRRAVQASLGEGSLAAVVSSGYGLAMVLAASYMAFAFVGAMVLSAPRRARDLAYLRALGVSGSGAVALTLIEHGLTVLMALVPGTALGVGLALLLEPALGLERFGGVGTAAPTIDWLALAAMLAALAGLSLVALIGGTWLSRQAPLMDALRIGEA